MSAPTPAYTLRWKGRTHGPYSLRTLEAMLAANEIGMSWEALVDGEWLTVGELLERHAPAPAPRVTARPSAPEVLPADQAGASVPTATFWPGALTPTEPPCASAGPRRVRVPQPGPGPVVSRPRPAAAPEPEAGPPPPSPRRHALFATLGLALGFTGLHNFYAGRWAVGAAQFALAAAGVFFGLGLIAAWLWALVEVICVQSDGQGRRFR